MKGEPLKSINLQIWHEIAMPNGGRIVDTWPLDEKHWPSLDMANRNVYLLDSTNKVVWQVRREDGKYVDWDSRNRHAKEEDPERAGYLDPFWSIGEKYFIKKVFIENGSVVPGYRMTYFDTYTPGRLLRLTTRWWAYDLDPETGVATCTGEQVK